jgi:myo-inositol-1(or 4)-monophosphatase
MPLLSANLNIMEKACKKASKLLIRDFGEVEKLQVSKKGPGDFVTNSDKRTEKIIINELSLARPDYSFLAEESGASGKSTEFKWIIDPIDGTTNFLHGVPYFAISIGLEKNKEIICGMIFNPITNEMFYAEKGKGAYLNNSRIRVSSRKNIDECVLLTGGPILSYKNKEIFFKEYESVSRKVVATRKFGSSALDLAYLASGRCDGVWERNLNYWDIAAGIIIVKEAGGTVTDFKGGDKYIEDRNLLATNSKIDKDLIALLA